MTDYERQLTSFWDNYIIPTDKQGWESPHDTPVDWNQVAREVAHEERMRNWAREEADADDDSVGTFDSALEEEESRVESFEEMLERIDWVERNGVFRTLYPIGRPSNMLPGCGGDKVRDPDYLHRMIAHEERKEFRIGEEIGFFNWKIEQLGNLRNRLEVKTAVQHVKVLRKKLRLVTAKKAIWNYYLEDLSNE